MSPITQFINSTKTEMSLTQWRQRPSSINSHEYHFCQSMTASSKYSKNPLRHKSSRLGGPDPVASAGDVVLINAISSYPSG